MVNQPCSYSSIFFFRLTFMDSWLQFVWGILHCQVSFSSRGYCFRCCCRFSTIAEKLADRTLRPAPKSKWFVFWCTSRSFKRVSQHRKITRSQLSHELLHCSRPGTQLCVPWVLSRYVCFDADPDPTAKFKNSKKHLLLFTGAWHTVTHVLYGWRMCQLAELFLRD